MDGVTAAGGGSGAGDGCNDGRHPKKEQRQRWDVHLACKSSIFFICKVKHLLVVLRNLLLFQMQMITSSRN
ncbi:hypothetical protein LINGRAHAP2_LOCUS17259 [Linum grandiflorum]